MELQCHRFFILPLSFMFSGLSTFHDIFFLLLFLASHVMISSDGDGGIFANSNLGKALEQNKLHVPKDKNLPGTQCPVPYVIVADESFLLKTYLLRPYPGSIINGDIQKQVFNYRLSRAPKTQSETWYKNFESFLEV